MTHPANMSLKGICDWAEQPSQSPRQDPVMPDGREPHINADMVDGMHYTDLKADWEAYADTHGGGGGGVVAMGTANFAGNGGYVTIGSAQGMITMPDDNYLVYVIPSADTDSRVGEYWVPEADKGTTSFRVYNDGSATTQFRWAVATRSSSTSTNNAAGGDLSGTYPDPTVAKIQGIPVSTTDPTDGQVLKYSAASGKWEPAADATGAITVPYYTETFGPGTFQRTIPVGVTKIKVSGWAAGGAAGQGLGVGMYSQGGGGGGGQYTLGDIIDATPGGTITISVGSGQTQASPAPTSASVGANGAHGPSTTISGGATYTLTGGNGGRGGWNPTQNHPGSGGAATPTSGNKYGGGAGGTGGGDWYPETIVTNGLSGANSSHATGGPNGVYNSGNIPYTPVYGNGYLMGGAGGGASRGQGGGGVTITGVLGSGYIPSGGQVALNGGGGGGGSPGQYGGTPWSIYDSWNTYPCMTSAPGRLTIEWGEGVE